MILPFRHPNASGVRCRRPSGALSETRIGHAEAPERLATLIAQLRRDMAELDAAIKRAEKVLKVRNQ